VQANKCCFFSLLLVLQLVFPVCVAFLAKVFPSFLFPAPRAGKELLGECQHLAQRFVVVSVVINAVVWFVWAVFLSSASPIASDGDRIVLALSLEWPNVAFLVFLVIRVATNRGTDVKAVLGQRTDVSAATEISIRVLNNTMVNNNLVAVLF
jgi:hypothetical protein